MDGAQALEDAFDQICSTQHASAESIARAALRLTPLPGETAQQTLNRFRDTTEAEHPEYVIGLLHPTIDVVMATTQTCGCDPDDGTYGEDHYDSWCERLIVTVCAICNARGQGPDWAPDHHTWPCPEATRIREKARLHATE